MNTSTVEMGEVVTITEAARRLGVNVRTVQRRLDKGTLQAVIEGDTRRVMLRDTEGDTTRQVSRDTRHDRATHDATRATDESNTTRQGDATGGDSVARHDATQRDTPRTRTDELADELTNQLRQENALLRAQAEATAEREAWLKSQIEDANRRAAEATAALREMIRAQPKRLTEGDQSTVEFDRTPEPAQVAESAPKADRKRPWWSRFFE